MNERSSVGLGKYYCGCSIENIHLELTAFMFVEDVARNFSPNFSNSNTSLSQVTYFKVQEREKR